VGRALSDEVDKLRTPGSRNKIDGDISRREGGPEVREKALCDIEVIFALRAVGELDVAGGGVGKKKIGEAGEGEDGEIVVAEGEVDFSVVGCAGAWRGLC